MPLPNWKFRCLLIVCWLAGSDCCWGQSADQRYQLGRRLNRFETAWQVASPETRAECVAPMEKAVQSFFGLQLAQAARLLDEAWMMARRTPETERIARAAWNGLAVDLETSLLDAQSKTLRWRLRSIYTALPDAGAAAQADVPPETDGAATQPIPSLAANKSLPAANKSLPAANKSLPAANRSLPAVNLSLKLIQGGQTFAVESWGVPNLSTEKSNNDWIEWKLPDLPEGDYRIQATANTETFSDVDLIADAVSFVSDLDTRMQSVNAWMNANRKGKGDTRFMTTRLLGRELQQALKGEANETDYPWHQFLLDFEHLAAPESDIRRWIERESPRTFWLNLCDGKSNQVVRVEFPVPDRQPMQVLCAFHGAGGSENMFFETYGAGRSIDLARQRGWLVISPRQTMSLNGLNMGLEQILDGLAEIAPNVSHQAVLVGHSMGAAQAISQVSKYPQRVRAVAALGGGGRPVPSDALTKIPFWIAAGTNDFGRPGARALATQLERLRCIVTYRDYSEVEHMVIVQAALDDLFAFFDEAIRQPLPSE